MSIIDVAKGDARNLDYSSDNDDSNLRPEGSTAYSLAHTDMGGGSKKRATCLWCLYSG